MASSSTAKHNQIEPQHAFDQLAPFSVSASTKPCQIFINHRGPDVKYTLAAKIYQRLDGMGFRAFLDVEALEPGNVIPAEIEAAMTTACLHIAIFSPNYAQSPWCLAELSFMLKTGTKIIPIFYHVDPSDLRWVQQGKGIYAHAFSEHENKGRYTQEKLDEWKRALYNISFFSGCEVNNNGDEASVLKNIVNAALKVIENVPLWVADHPVGMDELVQAFESVASEDKVKITGIVGMGGSGKTTLAKELYNRNFSSFESRSFVSDVRDAASRNALPEKQKKLLEDLGVQHLRFDSVDEGEAVLANRLSSLRALIVLDDVDHIEQLNALLPNKCNLGPQSMVIVTSRELGVLQSWGLSSIYRMQGLNKSLAEKIFCWHAFLQPSPPAGFESLVGMFLKACGGLPLSLKVLGGQLYGRDSRAYWESQLNFFSRILPGDIKQRLQVSYDALDEEEKEMFLDVACFFIGQTKSTVIALWDGSGWNGLHSLETLVNKCLVELVEGVLWRGSFLFGEVIRMHDHLRDMGKEIASRHSPYRLWRPEQIDNTKLRFKKTMLIRGIRPANAFVAFKEYKLQLMGDSSRRPKRLRFSNGLQILSVKGNAFTEEFASLSEDLVWLSWDHFPLKILPPWLTLTHLSVLELIHAKELEELWNDNADPPLQLRELTVWGLTKLQRLPSSIGRLQYLKKLCFRFYGSSLPEEFCGLHSLEYLKLFSTTLFSLPHGFGNLISLKIIYLKFCIQLSTLPDSFKELIHLERVELENCEMLSSLPLDSGNLISLKSIDLRYCKQLSTLPDSFKELIHLERVDLAHCETLSSLPLDFGNLISLKSIDLRYCKQLSTLPNSFKELIHLEELYLLYCAELQLKIDMLENITKLEVFELSGCEELEYLPHQIVNQAFLTELDLTGCVKLRGLPTSTGELLSLESLRIVNCPLIEELSSITNLASLKILMMINCPKVKIIEVLQHSKSLKNLRLQSSCWKELAIQSLEKLERLESLVVECDTISAVKPCIQSMKECPRQLCILGGVSCFVEFPIVNSSEFPDLEVREVEPSILDPFNLAPYLCYVEGKEKNEAERKVVRIRLFLDKYNEAERKLIFLDMMKRRGNLFFLQENLVFFRENFEVNKNKKAMVVRGEEARLVEAFYQLLALLE